MTWGERVYEVPWLLSKVKPGTVLDIGSAESCYIRTLLDNGHLVSLNDIRHFDLHHPNAKCFVGDIRGFNVETLGVYDNVLCISTLEHMCLTAYNQKADWKVSPIDSQLEALDHMFKFVAPGGQLILTVPFGQYNHGGWVITYNSNAIDVITSRYKTIEETYFTLTNRDTNEYKQVLRGQCPLKSMDAYPERGMRAWSVACLILGIK